jgi:aminocyclopropanecarboxylate oxidase
MHKMMVLVNKHYEHNMDKGFYNSEIAKTLAYEKAASDVDWECSFMYRHQPKSNSHDIPEALG